MKDASCHKDQSRNGHYRAQGEQHKQSVQHGFESAAVSPYPLLFLDCYFSKENRSGTVANRLEARHDTAQ